MNKCVNNRFQIQSNSLIQPYSIVDLLHIDNERSLTHQCINTIEKRWYIEDIEPKKIGARENADILIIDNENLSKEFVCCLLLEDVPQFVTEMQQLLNFGKSVAKAEPYVPEKFQMCIVFHPDADGTEVWYRAQFQVQLANDRAQVGLIDFEISIVVEMCNIRKFSEQFAFGRKSFVGKIRSEDISMDLLNRDLFQSFNTITAQRLRPIGTLYELHFDQNYFIDDDNIEEEMLQLED